VADTADLRLSPLLPEHLEHFWRWRNQPSTRRFNPLKQMTREQAREHLASCCSELGELRADGKYRWLVEAGSWPVGIVSLMNFNPQMNVAEISYSIGEEHQRRGFATAAVRTLVEKAFAESELRRMVAYVHSENAASLRVLEKVGFTREGLLRAHYLVNGQPADEVVFRILRGELR
jgi:RimJ/RimL family protein N-acetyltransferase